MGQAEETHIGHLGRQAHNPKPFLGKIKKEFESKQRMAALRRGI
jgi:hypothetical protein